MRLIILLLLPCYFFSQDGTLFSNKDSLLEEGFNIISKYEGEDLTRKEHVLLKEAYISTGNIFCNEVGQYDSALFYYNKGLENDLLNLDSGLYVKCITGIGKVYGMTQRLDEAILKHEEAIKIQQEKGDTLGLISSFYQIGVCYYDKDRAIALDFFNKSNQLSLIVSYNQYIAKTYRAIGQFYLDIKEIDSALLYLNKALPILEAENEFYDLCNLNLQFALLHSRSKKYNIAITYAEKAQKVANKYSYLHLLKNVHDVLTEIYYYKGDCDKAIENLEIKHQIVDSLSGLEVQKNIEELTILYNVKLKEEKNQQLEAEIKATRLEKISDRYLFFILLLIIIIMCIVIYAKYLLKKRKLTISDIKMKVIEVKKRELTQRLSSAQKMILEKNSLIEKLKVDISESVHDEEKSKLLLEKLNTKNEWSEFMIEFEMLYPSFFSKLNNVVSESLTKNDIRLSALMKLNLSNKEISDLLYVSDAAIKKGKNRLSKKMILDKGEKLTGYINRL
jgi:tetratricopeptide (TPR) repeat protein